MDQPELDLEWYQVEPDEEDEDAVYIEPEGMVSTALTELGAHLVAVQPELPEPVH